MPWIIIPLAAVACILTAFYIWYKTSGLSQSHARRKILMLHNISQAFDFSISNISRKGLEKYVDKALELGFEFVSLNAILKPPASEKKRRMAITFDDGYSDIYEPVADFFIPRKIPVTIFMTSGFIGKRADWDYKPTSIRHLSTEQIQKLAESELVTIGSHTVTHPNLTALKNEQIFEELLQSRKILAKITGRKIEYLSYPFGRFNTIVTEQAEKVGYKAAFCGVPSKVTDMDNLFAVTRIPLNLLDNLFTFTNKVRPGVFTWMEFSRARVIELFSGLTYQVRGRRKW